MGPGLLRPARFPSLLRLLTSLEQTPGIADLLLQRVSKSRPTVAILTRTAGIKRIIQTVQIKERWVSPRADASSIQAEARLQIRKRECILGSFPCIRIAMNSASGCCPSS